jgi:hypothetical protein
MPTAKHTISAGLIKPRIPPDNPEPKSASARSV